MKHAWVIVANSTLALFYSISSRDRVFNLVQKLSHQSSKFQDKALVSDRPGHYEKGVGRRGAYEEAITHQELEKGRFAKQIGETLEQGRIAHLFQGIIVIAEPHFYGLITKKTTSHVQKMVHFHFSQDYTHYSEEGLREQLKTKLQRELNLILI